MEQTKFDTFVKHIKNSFEEITEELIDTKYELCQTINEKTDAKVAIIIGITGKSKGRILLQCDFKTASDFAVAMNCGDLFDDQKEMYLYMAEFANMFCGRATTYINNEFKEREAWLTPPAIFSAKDLQIDTPSVQSEKIYYTGQQGDFLVDIGFEGDN